MHGVYNVKMVCLWWCYWHCFVTLGLSGYNKAPSHTKVCDFIVIHSNTMPTFNNGPTSPFSHIIRTMQLTQSLRDNYEINICWWHERFSNRFSVTTPCRLIQEAPKFRRNILPSFLGYKIELLSHLSAKQQSPEVTWLGSV